MKFSALAKALGLPEADLRELIQSENLDVDAQAAELTPAEAALVREAFGQTDAAEAYDELIAAERERTIVKTAKKRKTDAQKSRDKVLKQKAAAEAKPDVIEIGDQIIVKEFAEKTGIPVVKIIGDLMKNGVLATMNQSIDFDTALLIADNYQIKLKRLLSASSAEDLLEGNLEALLAQDEAEDLSPRPPIVTVMGHVDHGKTSILDAIRETHVAAGEHGGITQHIGAYQAKVTGGRLITFLDTPGHEAFTEMRARGAQVTDVAVLVVAASEGIKPQTIESINHAREAGVPIVVAMNKMDLPDANPDHVKAQLAEHGLQCEDWGGDVPCIPVSALKRQGIDTLLETILLVADMKSLAANPNRKAVATVIEAHLDPGLGAVATVIVNTGTLHIKDDFVVGETYGKVKSMLASNGAHLREALPSMPVRLAGFDRAPHVGDILQVMPSEHAARAKASEIATLRAHRTESLGEKGLAQIISQIQAGKLKELKLVVKADTNGSLQALTASLLNIKNEEVTTKVIHAGVGQITEGDISIAEASGALVLGFNVGPNQLAEARAQRNKVEILTYDVIYKLLEDVKGVLAGLLEPEDVAVELGDAEVLAIFMTGKKDMIIGCRITNGKVTNHAKMRVKRAGELVGEGEVRSLKREKENASEIGAGKECGIRFSGNLKIQVGDTLQFYQIEKKLRVL